jgi:uncharacterized protein YceK
MKNLKLLLCLCLLLSGIYSVRSQDEQSKTKSATTRRGFPNIFSPVGNLFDKVFNRKKPFVCDLPVSVTALNISSTEIPTICSENDSECVNNSRLIKVSTVAVDPEGITLKYLYTVTGGKITGQGANVVWDLSQTTPGTYTITAAVDDGRGVIGTTQTKTATIK